MPINDISGDIVDAAYHIHVALGPGLLESVYEIVLAHELKKRGYDVVRQKPIPILYDGLVFEEGFRADLIVNDTVVVELKSVEQLANVHKKQLLTYLRLMKKPLGLLINFNESYIKDGIVRIANCFFVLAIEIFSVFLCLCERHCENQIREEVSC